jgi:hypothetical protein
MENHGGMMLTVEHALFCVVSLDICTQMQGIHTHLAGWLAGWLAV